MPFWGHSFLSILFNIDDTLIFCDSEQQFEALLQKMNSLHQNLLVNSEFESDGSHPFSNILLNRRVDGSIIRFVHRQSTWSGRYLHFTSSKPIREKRDLEYILGLNSGSLCVKIRQEAVCSTNLMAD